ncbi:MAG: hypothetical protein ABH871_08455 [Pseudomonadota bacterium]
MPNITAFDTKAHHIHFVAYVVNPSEKRIKLRAVLDTGAPFTEFSDQFLHYAKFIDEPSKETQIKPGLQTQKYGKLTLPQVEICGHKLKQMPVYLSHFEKHWGVDALIGLDFFRQFQVTVNYRAGQIITEPLAD